MSTQTAMSTPDPRGQAPGSHDPRDRLVREKYFTLRPKPLERYLWQQGLPQAAERVFWLHWEEGMRNRDWCSEVPLKRVAALCCIDTSTVTRAYQVLKTLGLIRRESAGRDPENPFQQATAVTEVRIPRDLLTELARAPNRTHASRLGTLRSGEGAGPTPREPVAAQTAPKAPESVPERLPGAPASPPTSQPVLKHPSRQDIQAMWGRASTTERSRFFTASRDGTTGLEFDPDTKLTPEDRGQLLAQLEQLARARRAPPSPVSAPIVSTAVYAKPRRLSVLELARTRKRIGETVPAHEAPEVLRQVVWAVEEGALRRFEMPLAVNIALKKIREGAWTRPNRMPPHWMRAAISSHARAETCSAA
jgi:hypothetical protein